MIDKMIDKIIGKIIGKYLDTLVEGPNEGMYDFSERKDKIAAEIISLGSDIHYFLMSYCDPEQNSYNNQFRPEGRKKNSKKSQKEKDRYLLGLIDDLSEELLNRGLIEESNLVKNLVSPFEDFGDGDYIGEEYLNDSLYGVLDKNNLPQDYTSKRFDINKMTQIKKSLEKNFQLNKIQINLILQIIKSNIN